MGIPCEEHLPLAARSCLLRNFSNRTMKEGWKFLSICDKDITRSTEVLWQQGWRGCKQVECYLREHVRAVQGKVVDGLGAQVEEVHPAAAVP